MLTLLAGDAVQTPTTRLIDAHAIALARIAELEAAIREMHDAIPGGSVCDPQRVADDMRDIAKRVGVTFDD